MSLSKISEENRIQEQKSQTIMQKISSMDETDKADPSKMQMLLRAFSLKKKGGDVTNMIGHNDNELVDNDKDTDKNKNEEDFILLGLRAPTLEKRNHKRFLFYPNDRLKEMFWDTTISIILLLTCFITPINLAFAEDLEKIDWYMRTNDVIDMLFFLDILVNFNSAYQNEMYEIIDDRKKIAKNYILGWFFIDLFAIMPFNYIIDLFTNN